MCEHDGDGDGDGNDDGDGDGDGGGEGEGEGVRETAGVPLGVPVGVQVLVCARVNVCDRVLDWVRTTLLVRVWVHVCDRVPGAVTVSVRVGVCTLVTVRVWVVAAEFVCTDVGVKVVAVDVAVEVSVVVTGPLKFSTGQTPCAAVAFSCVVLPRYTGHFEAEPVNLDLFPGGTDHNCIRGKGVPRVGVMVVSTSTTRHAPEILTWINTSSQRTLTVMGNAPRNMPGNGHPS